MRPRRRTRFLSCRGQAPSCAQLPPGARGSFFKGLRRIEWVILGVEDSTNLGIARGFCILAGLYLASMMDGTNIETPSAAVGYVFVSGFSAGADSTRDFR